MSHLLDNRRHNIVTASNAWASVNERQKLWRQMTMREPPFEGNEATAWGNLHERDALSAIDKYSELSNSKSAALLTFPVPYKTVTHSA